MTYRQALDILEQYYEKSFFTPEETEAFMLIIDSCKKK